jgi:hypothetical protein
MDEDSADHYNRGREAQIRGLHRRIVPAGYA